MTACLAPRAENTQCRMKLASHQLVRPWRKIRMSKCSSLAPERALIRRIDAWCTEFPHSPITFRLRISLFFRAWSFVIHFAVLSRSIPRRLKQNKCQSISGQHSPPAQRNRPVSALPGTSLNSRDCSARSVSEFPRRRAGCGTRK